MLSVFKGGSIKVEGNNERDKRGIKRDMEELREILNEICDMEAGERMLKKRLILSQKLDQLIVEYMNKEKL